MEQWPLASRRQVLPALDDFVPAMEGGDRHAHDDPQHRETGFRQQITCACREHSTNETGARRVLKCVDGHQVWL